MESLVNGSGGSGTVIQLRRVDDSLPLDPAGMFMPRQTTVVAPMRGWVAWGQAAFTFVEPPGCRSPAAGHLPIQRTGSIESQRPTRVVHAGIYPWSISGVGPDMPDLRLSGLRTAVPCTSGRRTIAQRRSSTAVGLHDVAWPSPTPAGGDARAAVTAAGSSTSAMTATTLLPSWAGRSTAFWPYGSDGTSSLFLEAQPDLGVSHAMGDHHLRHSATSRQGVVLDATPGTY